MTNDSQPRTLNTIDVLEIMKMIPHRFPMLMVDRVVDVIADESAVGIKNVSINEHFFQGHFPQQPVMPGVMIIESMAQTAGILVVHTLGEESRGKLVYFMTIDNARFRRKVEPGDQLRVFVKKIRARGPVWKFAGEVRVDGHLAAEAEFSAMIVDNPA